MGSDKNNNTRSAVLLMNTVTEVTTKHVH